MQGDLLDTHALRKELQDQDVVIHLAAKVAHPDHDMHSHYFEQINHWGTGILVDLASQINSIQTFIYLSSSAVYGDSVEVCTEDQPPNPVSAYAQSKYRGEQQVLRLPDRMKKIIFRSGNTYGYNSSMRTDTVVNKFMFDAQTKGKILINGDGHQIRSFIHVDKLVHVIRESIRKDLNTGVYNVTEHNLSINALAENLKSIYPKLEYLSINQHATMRNNILKTPTKMEQLIPLPEKSLKDELEEFKGMFGV